ncbi:putative spermidine/putrescine transport system substrate-binding protein [Bradyrhizobium niftali]|uniref:ABC transporter substrate-binding protein n=1 Tax=Bradyrhizobium niftali TaxID=2560055 RepID=UPI0038380D28
MAQITRRKLLHTGAAALAATPFVISQSARAATTISLVSWGGSWGDFLKKFWIEPFTEESGISVTLIAGPDSAKVKAQVESNNVLWDVVDSLPIHGPNQGLWEPIDYKIIDPSRFTVKKETHGVPYQGFYGGISYDPSRTKPPAKDFAQFWDVKSFPGRRALRNSATGMLEIALVADGIAPDKLYPLEVERGFNALDRIKPHVKKWYAETGQGNSLIQTNEVDYSFNYLNRVNSAKDAGVSIEFSLDQCIIYTGYFSVPKGCPRREAAMRFIEFTTRPQQQVAMINQAKGAFFSGVKGVEELIDPAVRRAAPEFNNPKHVFYSSEYWGDHVTTLDRRFKEWILT